MVRDGLFALPIRSGAPPSAGLYALVGERTSSAIWHERLGHPNPQVIRSVLRRHQLPYSSSSLPTCDACCRGKTHKLPHYSSTTTYKQPLELVFSDVWGPSPITSPDGFRYYISFVDVYSKYIWLYPLRCKSAALHVFKIFKNAVEKQLNNSIVSIQTDGGGEFLAFKPFLQQHGITHRISCPHSHAQNGTVEHRHRHIVDSDLTLLARANLPRQFWPDAFATTVYLLDHMPTMLLQTKSPFEALYQTPPDYFFLRVFGCNCYPNLRPFNKHKFDFRSKPCIFLGYASNHYCYKCYDPNHPIFSPPGMSYFTSKIFL